MDQTLILGIDPGSHVTGFAAVQQQGRRLSLIESGEIHLPQSAELSVRLAHLHEALDAVLERVRPDVVAVEDVFASCNLRSALALGQARGVALALAGRRKLPVCAYPPATVKKAVSGHGRADKQQVQRMVAVLLSLERHPSVDEADAMAIAICHALCYRAERMDMAPG